MGNCLAKRYDGSRYSSVEDVVRSTEDLKRKVHLSPTLSRLGTRAVDRQETRLGPHNASTLRDTINRAVQTANGVQRTEQYVIVNE